MLADRIDAERSSRHGGIVAASAALADVLLYAAGQGQTAWLAKSEVRSGGGGIIWRRRRRSTPLSFNGN
jgi:hypothetical protein